MKKIKKKIKPVSNTNDGPPWHKPTQVKSLFYVIKVTVCGARYHGFADSNIKSILTLSALVIFICGLIKVSLLMTTISSLY